MFFIKLVGVISQRKTRVMEIQNFSLTDGEIGRPCSMFITLTEELLHQVFGLTEMTLLPFGFIIFSLHKQFAILLSENDEMLHVFIVL